MKIPSLILLVAAFLLLVGCESTKDPLLGWKSVAQIGCKSGEMSATIETLPTYKAITDDVQVFVNKLPIEYFYQNLGYQDEKTTMRRYCYWIQRITLFEDGTGQHAVKIEIPVNGDYLNYVLIYDKSNARIKTTKFSSGHYAC
jgi:hypothetical protein